MRRPTTFAAPVLLLGSLLLGPSAAAQNRIDRIRPDAPELSPHGEYAIGVRTLGVVHREQVDILRLDQMEVEEGEEPPRYDRPLVLEVWYPALGGAPTPYEVLLRDGETVVRVQGTAARDAVPDRAAAPYPLVLISHGYPGNRFLLSHLGENLASKGYVVASIDHTDSTYGDQATFGSTLVNRPLDQLFVLREMARLGATEGHFLEGMVKAETTGLVGYSMGGYGAVITAGGGVTEAAVTNPEGAPDGALAIHRAGSAAHAALFDDRIKGVVAFAPWGMERDVWDAAGLAGVRIPMLLVAGSADEVSGYETGVRAIFEQIVSVDRYLLTFENAGHNAAAPMPAPVESFFLAADASGSFPFDHYADPVWDTVRMNNIAQHFVTAFFGLYLRGDEEMRVYLEPETEPGDAEAPVRSPWPGFRNGTAVGLKLEKRTTGRKW